MRHRGGSNLSGEPFAKLRFAPWLFASERTDSADSYRVRRDVARAYSAFEGVRSVSVWLIGKAPVSLWGLASYHMQPAIMRDVMITPFTPASIPSPAMVAWAIGYLVVTLGLAISWFRKRPL